MWLGIFSNFSVWVAVINCNEKEVHPRTQNFHLCHQREMHDVIVQTGFDATLV